MDERIRRLGSVWNLIADTTFVARAPMYDRIARAVAEDQEVLSLVLEARPEAHFPLLLLAAVHYLTLSGIDHPLAAVYAGQSDADPVPLFHDLCLSHQAEILELLATRNVQTNEVGRSALLGPALTVAADRIGAPFALVDVGASAGLNLRCDHYLLDYGAAGTTGPAHAAVRIDCDVVGAENPPIRPSLPPLVAAVGVDRSPVDVSDPKDARWLLACVWPETDRIPRTELAIREAAADPPTVVRGDAFTALPDAVRGLPAGAPVCVSTFWVFGYFPVDQRPAFIQLLVELASERPLVWLYGEGPNVGPDFGEPPDECVLGLVFFDKHEPKPVFLAQVHPHGDWIKWMAP